MKAFSIHKMDVVSRLLIFFNFFLKLLTSSLKFLNLEISECVSIDLVLDNGIRPLRMAQYCA